MRKIPSAPLVQSCYRLGRFGANANHLPASPRVFSKIKLTWVQPGRNSSQLAKDAQVVALVHTEQMTFDGELAIAARRLPLAPIANPSQRNGKATALADGNRAFDDTTWVPQAMKLSTAVASRVRRR